MEFRSISLMKTSSVIGKAWAGHLVGFDYLLHEGRHFVAFYDEERRLSVAARREKDPEWEKVQLPGIARNSPSIASAYQGVEPRSDIVPWDSHNGVIMAIDGHGHLHLSGNMHVDPLVYFRTTRPLDIRSFERLDRMTGQEEDRCTYPNFLRGADGRLIFRYRSGRSGDGADYYNLYDPGSGMWSRLLDRPLLDGLGRMNAYAGLPQKGPDDLFHMIWVWRDTSDCATNHDLSYMRSPDLVHWTNAAGEPLELPVVLESKAVVDPVPPGGGLLNGRQWLGFDQEKRPIVSYTKYDASGKTQAYCARFENGSWISRQISVWDYRWEFGGRGSLPNSGEIQLEPVSLDGDGTLLLPYQHVKRGRGVWRLRPDDLAVIETLPGKSHWPDELTRAESEYPGIQVQILPARDLDNRPVPRYVVRWETLGRNRDKPRTEWPPPGELRCYCLAAALGEGIGTTAA